MEDEKFLDRFHMAGSTRKLVEDTIDRINAMPNVRYEKNRQKKRGNGRGKRNGWS